MSKNICIEPMSEEEIIRYAKIFSNATGDIHSMHKLEITTPNKTMTIYETELWEMVINLLSKKNKVIDLMAEQLAGLTIFDMKKEEPLILSDKEEVKEYFYKKAEGEVE